MPLETPLSISLAIIIPVLAGRAHQYFDRQH
jgi:hypothetical protein